jgi:hypothetical protein
MIVINLFGAPGSGKSTGAAYIFSKLKMNGINAELVTEAAKDMTWEGRNVALSDQLYVSGCQSLRLTRLNNNVDVVVTDSPLPIGLMYVDGVSKTYLQPVLLQKFNQFSNINYYVNRCKPYNPKGRNQTEEESDEIAKIIKRFMNDNDIEFKEVLGCQDGYDYIVEEVLKNGNWLDKSW